MWCDLTFIKNGEERPIESPYFQLECVYTPREFTVSQKCGKSIPTHSWMQCLRRFLEFASFHLLSLLSSSWLQHWAGCLLVTTWLLGLYPVN